MTLHVFATLSFILFYIIFVGLLYPCKLISCATFTSGKVGRHVYSVLWCIWCVC